MIDADRIPTAHPWHYKMKLASQMSKEQRPVDVVQLTSEARDNLPGGDFMKVLPFLSRMHLARLDL